MQEDGDKEEHKLGAYWMQDLVGDFGISYFVFVFVP